MPLWEWQYHLVTPFCFHVSVPKSLFLMATDSCYQESMSDAVIVHTDRNFGSFNFWVQLWAATLQPGAWNSPRLLRKPLDCQAVKSQFWNYSRSYFWNGYTWMAVWSTTTSAPGRHLTASQNEARGVPLNSVTATIYCWGTTWGWYL